MTEIHGDTKMDLDEKKAERQCWNKRRDGGKSTSTTLRKQRRSIITAESSHTAGVSLAMLKCGMREQRKKCKSQQQTSICGP